MNHATLADLEQALSEVVCAPGNEGVLALIVRRPAVGERQVITAGALHVEHGLEGDDWERRPSAAMEGRGPHPAMQVTVMSARVAALVAGERARWPLAGDQLYVDLDLGERNLPSGSRLLVGEAELEVSAEVHAGCKKFAERFGVDALKWVNSPRGRALRLRGINARVVKAGVVRSGDRVAVLSRGR